MTPEEINNHKQEITPNLGFTTLVASLSTLQFGYHLAVLNAPADYISCQAPYNADWTSRWPRCIPTDSDGVTNMTTMFTVGGLVASVVLGFTLISSTYGRKSINFANSILFILGSTLLLAASNLDMIYAGRFITGIAAGLLLVVAPLLVNEVTPFNHRGLLGLLVLFGIASGIFVAQALLVVWSNYDDWRKLFATAVGIATIQFVSLFSTVELPKWLVFHGDDLDQATKILHDLRSESHTVPHEINHWRLLSDSRDSIPDYGLASSQSSLSSTEIGKVEYLVSLRFSHERIAVLLLLTGQQLCGMNAITFYGVSILEKSLPSSINVLHVTASFGLVNALAALAISPFIDTIGRKPLLISSLFIMGICSLALCVSIVYDYTVVVALACYGFILGYSTGIGQLAFLLISELAHHETVLVAQAWGGAFNWLSNIAIAAIFPILHAAIGGYTFLVFFTLCTLYAIAIWFKVPETKDRAAYSAVWGPDTPAWAGT